MHRLKRVMKALSSQIFQTTRNNQKRHDSKYQRAHVAHARRRRVSFLGIDSSRKKKARDSCQKKGTRENKILFSSLCSERVCLLRFSRHRSRIIRSSVVVYYYSVVVSRKRGTLRSSFLSEKEGERGAKKKNWI